MLESLQTKHLIFTTESKEAYNNKVALGFDETAGYKSLGYETNALVETHFTVAEGFWLDVRMSQDRAALMGEEGQRLLMGDLVEFKYLAAQLGRKHRRKTGSKSMWKLKYPSDPQLPDSRLQTLKALLLKSAKDDPIEKLKAKEQEEVEWLAT